MLEKLKVTQPLLASELELSIRGDNFSQSSLFCGDQYSSKMTAAIECAKALSCFKDKAVECDCKSCLTFDSFTMQNVVIISNRNYQTRIDAAIESFNTLRDDFSKKNLIEVVRILLLSYHSCLYIDKKKALFKAAYEVNDKLIEFVYHKSTYGIREAKSFSKSLSTLLKPLLDQDKKNLTNISVDSVRSLQNWVGQTKVVDKAQVIIIEGIEKSNDSVRNSLLKILEEPGEGVYFILLSEDPSRIMKTILSRVRRYYFPSIDIDKQQLILESFKIEDKNINTIEKYFLSSHGFKEAEFEVIIDQLVSSFYDESVGFSLEELWNFCEMFDKSDQCDYILKMLSNRIENAFICGHISATHSKQMMSFINEDSIKYKVFNISKKNFIENLYRKLLGVINE
ncbi:MAG: hypothetical protein JJE21_01730 [Spirochaetaceae bacterium]|nr:hypothetical protein [Spirochaetaceae bacterium]